MNAHKQASFCCPVKTSHHHGNSFGIFDREKAQLPAIRITEQPMLLTNGEINSPG